MKFLLPLLLFPLFFAASAFSAPAEDVFVLDLNKPEIRAALGRAGAVITNDGPGGKPAVRFTLAGDKAPRPLMARFPVKPARIAGAQVVLSAKIRGENIRAADPEKKLPVHHGGKLMLSLDGPSGKRWPGTGPHHGTFDWRETSVRAGIGSDITEALICLGMEGAVGTVWLSDIRLRVTHPPVVLPPPDAAAKAAVANAKTTLRGVMSPQPLFRYTGRNPASIEDDFDTLQAWNVNLVRWQLVGAHIHRAGYRDWFAKHLEVLPLALDAAAKRGIKIVIDLHSKPGHSMENRTSRMFLEKEWADLFVEVWEEIARRFKGHPAIHAYGLINEPVQLTPSPEGVEDWYDLQLRAARAIRAIDPDTPIMFAPEEYNNPPAFSWLKPVDIPNVIYEVHVYYPHVYTHQHVRSGVGLEVWMDLSKSMTYPGRNAAGKKIDREALRAHIQPTRDFQLATGAKIFVGEFSAARWAPGAAQYIDDLISLFEEYGWDWTYHSFRESTIWNVEHVNTSPRKEPVTAPADEPTDREKVLRKWLKLNERGK